MKCHTLLIALFVTIFAGCTKDIDQTPVPAVTESNDNAVRNTSSTLRVRGLHPVRDSFYRHEHKPLDTLITL